MKIQLLTACALGAASLALAAAPAQATTILSFGAASSPGKVGWAMNGSGGTFQTGTSSKAASDSIQVQLANLLAGDTANVASTFTLSGVAPAGNAAVAAGSHLFQDGIGTASKPGSFSIISAKPFTYEGHLYGAGVNILSGTFDNAEIAGQKGGFTGFASTVMASDVLFTSAIGLMVSSSPDNNDFVLDLASISPGLKIGGVGNALQSFNATAAGQFVSVVPEPATWATMMVGFGGLGVAMRSRRRQVAATA